MRSNTSFSFQMFRNDCKHQDLSTQRFDTTVCDRPGLNVNLRVRDTIMPAPHVQNLSCYHSLVVREELCRCSDTVLSLDPGFGCPDQVTFKHLYKHCVWNYFSCLHVIVCIYDFFCPGLITVLVVVLQSREATQWNESNSYNSMICEKNKKNKKNLG